MPKRIQLRRKKGWRKPEGAIVVSRPSKWGNPYPVIDGVIDRGEAVALYRLLIFHRDVRTPANLLHLSDDEIDSLIDNRDRVWASLGELRGHDLCCWCPLDRPCHADVLLDLANREPGEG